MENHYHFIVNPAAGGGRSAVAAEWLRDILETRKVPYRIVLTRNSEEVIKYAQEALSQSPKAVIAVGGDGTVSEVAAVLTHTKIPMGIIGSGSGNDFVAGVLGKKRKLAFETLPREIDTILAGNTRSFDMASVNGQLFLNIGNMGLDADIAHSAEVLKKRFRGSAYLAATMKEIVKFKPIKCEITADNVTYDGEIMLVAVCNGNAYGGGFLIAPDADAADGLLTLCYVKKMVKPKLMMVFPTALFGRHTGFVEVEILNCRECEIAFEGELLLTLDGNLSIVKSPLRFELIPASLDILV